jgi:acyl dehydratase
MGPPRPRTFTISLARSGQFARLSGDYNPIHLAPVLARRSHFGGTVVHGVHTFLGSAQEFDEMPDWRGFRNLRTPAAVGGLAGPRFGLLDCPTVSRS